MKITVAVVLSGLHNQRRRRFPGPEIWQVVSILSDERWGEPPSKRIWDRAQEDADRPPLQLAQRSGAAASDGAAEIEPLDDIVALQLVDRIGGHHDLATDDGGTTSAHPD